jgi:hypoxanthine phosphoribosyltransferase
MVNLLENSQPFIPLVKEAEKEQLLGDFFDLSDYISSHYPGLLAEICAIRTNIPLLPGPGGKEIRATMILERLTRIVEGMVRFITFLQVHEKAGEPYETLVFLDKSSRPGAFIFQQVLKLRTDLLENIPKILFVDIGRSEPKDKNHIPLTDYPYKYQNLIDGKKICIVDEHTGSGVTLIKAEQLFRKRIGYKPKDVASHVLFKITPYWYDRPELIGVANTILTTDEWSLDDSNKKKTWNQRIKELFTAQPIPSFMQKDLEKERLREKQIAQIVASLL